VAQVIFFIAGYKLGSLFALFITQGNASILKWFLLYPAVLLTRGLAIILLFPLLTRFGLGLDWRTAVRACIRQRADACPAAARPSNSKPSAHASTSARIHQRTHPPAHASTTSASTSTRIRQHALLAGPVRAATRGRARI
jgi:hypothetical protein